MGLRILVVDDHPAVRRGLRGLLASQVGWEVIDEAVDGRDGLEKANHLRPDVILMDLTMPGMGGLEACRLIRENVPDSEVLIVTQHDSPQMLREAMAAGARGYIVKSNAARDLLTAVETVSQHQAFTSLGPPARPAKGQN